MVDHTASAKWELRSERSMAIQIVALIVIILLCYGAAFLGQLATTPNIPTWYASLEKPSFNPPNSVFPIVWGILYTVMAIAAWLVWRAPTSRARTIALVAFLIQLFFNVAWSWSFFGAQNPPLGLVVIAVLLVAIVGTVITFWRVVRIAALLLVPYLLWVGFATILNATIVSLN